MQIVLSNLRFVRRHYEDIEEKTEDIRPLTEEEARKYWDIFSSWSMGEDTKVDEIAGFCLEALPEQIIDDNDVLDVAFTD